MNTKEKKKSKVDINDLGPIFENLILVAIVAVIVVTFLDEIAVIFHWSELAHQKLMLLSVAFDVIFSIEFIVRIIVNARQNNAKHYLFHQRGWVDFISSFPLLILNSGPALAIFLFPDIVVGSGAAMGFFGSIKVLKAIRVTRILRLLRLVKILGKIHNTDSHMANRHISVISTTAIMSIIFIYGIFSFTGFLSFSKFEKDQASMYRRVIANVKDLRLEKLKKSKKVKTNEDFAKKYIGKLLYGLNQKNSSLVAIYFNETMILSNYTVSELKSKFHYFPDRTVNKKLTGSHIHMYQEDNYTFYISTNDIYVEQTKVQLVIFISILLMILLFMTGYTRHFVQNITDVVHIMRKGFTEDDFNLEVKVNPNFSDDEIFLLAKLYNETWLPMKSKDSTEKEEESTGGLSLDDFMNV